MNNLAAALAAIMPPAFWIGLAGLAVAVVLLAIAATDDRKNWIVERAPPLPIEFVNPRDDVWVSGRIECTTPLTVPGFGMKAVYYEYVERMQRIDAGGRPHWQTIRKERMAVDFDLVERQARIAVNGQDAEFDGLARCGPETYDRFYQRKARYFSYPGAADAVGSVSDDRRRLEKYRNIPLIVTARGRKQYIASRERSESWQRGLGGIMLLGSLVGILLGISLKLDVPPVTPDLFPLANVLGSAGLALLGFLGWWATHVYNQLVMHRERVRTAWRQIDVDLKNRHELLPRLEALVRSYAAHEQEVMELVAGLRQEPEALEGVDERSVRLEPLRRLWAVVEKYPILKADQHFLRLQTQLTALEEKLAHGRAFFNDSVQEYDNQRQGFPKNLVARLAGRFPVYPMFSD